MLENGLDGSRPVIAVVLDGTGYGLDGAIWGEKFCGPISAASSGWRI